MKALRVKSIAAMRRLPLPLRQRLVGLRDRACGGYASVVAALLESAPARTRIIVSEQMADALAMVRPLDYGGGSIMLHVDSLIELDTRLRSCAKEPETVAWIESHVKPGDVVFDIGANVGVYSFVIDRHSKGTTRVYAFEPGAATFLQLTRNIMLNGCEDRIVPLQIGFGANTRVATFNYSSVAPGAARHSIDAPVDNVGRAFVPAMRQPVLLYSVDGFIEDFGIEQPAHMKIDVDGGELDILKGAAKTLASRGLRSVMIELEPTSSDTMVAQSLFERAGFNLASVRSHGAATETSNYLFVRERPD